MTKRMKRIAALLTCGLVLASGTSVYAGNAEGTLLGYPISLEVSVRKASAMTAGSYPKTTIYPYRYATKYALTPPFSCKLSAFPISHPSGA